MSSPAQRAAPISPKQTCEASCTKAAELDVLSDLMALVEDGKEEEEEIA